MRYDVKKYLLLGLEDERDAFFKRAQEAGFIHFIGEPIVKVETLSHAVEKLGHAVKMLRSLPSVDQEEIIENEIQDVVEKIIRLKESEEALREQERRLQSAMSHIEGFGNFSTEDISFIEQKGKRNVQFYCAKQGAIDKANLADSLFYINSDHGLDYFIGIHREPTQYSQMIEMRIEHSWNELNRRYQGIRNDLHDHQVALMHYAKYHTALHRALTRELNALHLETAKNCVDFPLGNQHRLFLIQAWVPSHRLGELNRLVADMKIYVEEVREEPDEVVPTYLENKGLARIGEDLIHIYDTPSPKDKDPSLWVVAFFALFFSMIIGDGGYGLVFLSIAIYMRYKHTKLSGLRRRMLDLFTLLAFACILWGVLTTSFFGLSFAPDSAMRKVSLTSWLVEKKADYHFQLQDEVYHTWVERYPQLAEVHSGKEFLMQGKYIDAAGKAHYEIFSKFSDHIMLELALFVGVLHIAISMGRYLRRNWSYLGWMAFLVGAYLYTPIFLDVSSMVDFVFGIDRTVAAQNGLYLIYGGIGLAVGIALVRHKLLGLLEATNLIQIFSDVLSYLRLYALGLAGALLTETMANLASSMPLIFGLGILILGHAINIVLGIMGGVIHGLRLNFLEWYHYCFEGGGKIFQPLQKIKN